MSEPIHVGTFGDPDRYLTADGMLITNEEREALAGKFIMSPRDRVTLIPPNYVYTPSADAFAQGYADVMANSDISAHGGHCGPRWRPLRAWFRLTAWKFKSCPYDYGATGFCERRYVWDRGEWRRLMSERQLRQLEKEVM